MHRAPRHFPHITHVALLALLVHVSVPKSETRGGTRSRRRSRAYHQCVAVALFAHQQ